MKRESAPDAMRVMRALALLVPTFGTVYGAVRGGEDGALLAGLCASACVFWVALMFTE